MDTTDKLTFEQFCEEIPDHERPWLDRGVVPAEWVHERHAFWRENGYLILENFIPHGLIDAYCARYEADHGANAAKGYQSGTPYMTVGEIKDLCLYAPLIQVLNGIVGEEMAMSLNLTNWVSTERNWHQDDYLNPSHVNGHYLAAWIALDDIHPDSGPFEFVPGSHKWPVMRGSKVKDFLEPGERGTWDWPWKAERFLNGVFDDEIRERGARRKVWADAKKGDVLIWHPWLAHRGSKPKNPELRRKAMICHYSGVGHRKDMSKPVFYENGESRGYFFPF